MQTLIPLWIALHAGGAGGALVLLFLALRSATASPWLVPVNTAVFVVNIAAVTLWPIKLTRHL
jgi:hypothetical protein